MYVSLLHDVTGVQFTSDLKNNQCVNIGTVRASELKREGLPEQEECVMKHINAGTAVAGVCAMERVNDGTARTVFNEACQCWTIGA